MRPFVQFDGEGETANARQREIGGHPAVLLRNVCLRKIRTAHTRTTTATFRLESWWITAGGRSDGCTSWSPSDARKSSR